MKECLNCNNSVNDKAFECPYCGNTQFQKNEVTNAQQVIEPQKQALGSNFNKTQSDQGMYSVKLESLIEMALSDGELTEKEKQVLFKKAELEGIDLDEFEMVLDYRLKNILNKNLISAVISTSKISGSNNSLNPDRYIELEKLIEIALSDGILSETEKNTIINKGLSSGIPQDEISMILDSKVAEKQKILSQNAAPKSDKYGDIKKCPACGAIVTSFSSICGDCGHEFSNIGANISIEKLFQMLTEIDNRPREKFGIFEKGKQMDYESDLLNKKTEIIKNFPIPNTKNDIFEFLTYAVPYARLVKTGAESIFASKQWAGVSDSYKKNEIGKAWKYKCEQIIMKAKFSLKEDTKGLEEIKKYAQELGIK